MSGLDPSAHPLEGSEPPVAAAVFRVRGVVQGVGFRPFVYALARRCGLGGWVRNTSAGVRDRGRGQRRPTSRRSPPRCRTRRRERAYIASLERAAGRAHAAPARSSSSRAPPTRAPTSSSRPTSPLCDGLPARAARPADRRYGYPFTNCTNCGPRFTIIEIAALRPRAHDDARASRSATTAGASTRTRPTGASTPSPTPAPCAGRASSWWRRGAASGGADCGPRAVGRRLRSSWPSATRRSGAAGRAAARGRDPGRQGSRRLSPRLRRDQRRRGARAQAAQRAARQAAGRHVRRPRRAASPLPDRRERGGAAGVAGAPDRAARVAEPGRGGEPSWTELGWRRRASRLRSAGDGRWRTPTGTGRPRGRRAPALPGRDAAVHAAARAAAASGRPARWS